MSSIFNHTMEVQEAESCFAAEARRLMQWSRDARAQGSGPTPDLIAQSWRIHTLAEETFATLDKFFQKVNRDKGAMRQAISTVEWASKKGSVLPSLQVLKNLNDAMYSLWNPQMEVIRDLSQGIDMRQRHMEAQLDNVMQVLARIQFEASEATIENRTLIDINHDTLHLLRELFQQGGNPINRIPMSLFHH